MNTSIFISSYKRDFPYLRTCIQSINRFCRGFYEVVIQFPETDWPEFTEKIGPEIMSQSEIKYVPLAMNEWPGKGMLFHMNAIVHADTHCHNADFIGHFDSDAFFTEPVTPETFIKDGKPYLQYERFESIGKRHGGVMKWQENARRCLPFEIHYETMRGLPHFYEINTYEKTRDLMMLKTQMSVEEYIKQGRNEYPQEFCEHVTLGNVAIHCFHQDYELIDMATQQNPDCSRWPVIQCWSHGPPHLPQDIWIKGKQRVIIPRQLWKEHGFDYELLQNM